MRKSWICNYNESSLYIFMINATNDLLHDEFRARKQFQSSFNYLTIYFKYHSADSETETQLKKNEQEKNYNWHAAFTHVQTFQHVFKYWNLYKLSHEFHTAAHESNSVTD